VEYYNLLGLKVNIVSISGVLDQLKKIKENHHGYITVTGVHGIMVSQRNEKVKAAHLQSFITVPDGMPLVYIGKMKGFCDISRCYGPDLMDAVMAVSPKEGYRHFFYGGQEGRAQELKQHFENKYPGAKVVGIYTPPFRPLNDGEVKELSELIVDCKPDFLWVGLSTPKQELFMNEFISKLDVKIMFGVGAAFDIHTGYISSAPIIMQKLSLEWLYRLVQEPKRLWRRYLINNPLFLGNLLLQTLKLKRYDMELEA